MLWVREIICIHLIFHSSPCIVCTWQASILLFGSRAQICFGPILTAQERRQKISLRIQIFQSIPTLNHFFENDLVLYLFYHFWTQRIFLCKIPQRPHYKDWFSIKMSRSGKLMRENVVFRKPDCSLKEFVRGWLSKAGGSPSCYQHSLRHQLQT